MSTATAPRPARRAKAAPPQKIQVGPIGRLGRYTATHFRTVMVGWLLVALVLGFFAPRVEKALSGAGWEASGSQSVQARKLIERDFAGMGSYGLMAVLYSPRPDRRHARLQVRDRPRRADAAGQLRGAHRGRAGSAGLSISPDGHTAIVQAGAARNPNEMVAAADKLKGTLHGLSTRCRRRST